MTLEGIICDHLIILTGRISKRKRTLVWDNVTVIIPIKISKVQLWSSSGSCSISFTASSTLIRNSTANKQISVLSTDCLGCAVHA